MAAEDPCTGAVNWRGAAADGEDVALAVGTARGALPAWTARPHAERVAVLLAYKDALEKARPELVNAICADVGKTRVEADVEVLSMINKVTISRAAYEERTGTQNKHNPHGTTLIRHHPHGVLGVFGPFNLPGHLPNGHIVPALLAGNTVVFKPSELAPLSAMAMTNCWQRAGLPAGVLNVVLGGPETGMALAGAAQLDGVLFTGSAATGASLHRAFADRPGKILALEMGGNNPLVVWEARDLDAAAGIVLQSAFATSGQRCTCARRLIVAADAQGEALIERLAALVDRVIVGPPDQDPEPFMGPVISNAAALRLLAAQTTLVSRGARIIRPLTPEGDGTRPFLQPGLLDVTTVTDRPDEELFGPLLQIIRVPSFEAAITAANDTRFGLAAGLVSDDANLWAAFSAQVRAGVLSWNRPTTGAPSDAPFGGIGGSGNHRPSAYYAADYCAYPVVQVTAPAPVTPPVRGLRPQ